MKDKGKKKETKAAELSDDEMVGVRGGLLDNMMSQNMEFMSGGSPETETGTTGPGNPGTGSRRKG